MCAQAFTFIKNLEKNYIHNPVICFYCGKPLTFKKYYKQFESPKRFCSKKCEKAYNEEAPNCKLNSYSNNFCSQTEKAIYTYLTLQYPIDIITHNLKEVHFEPYEIDFAIQRDDMLIYIEFNGALHCTTRKKRNSSERTLNRHKLNDKIKKELLCNEQQKVLVRLWSEIGLYSSPETFDRALLELKIAIDNTFNFHCNKDYGYCLDIVVDKRHHIYKDAEKFLAS